MSYKAVLLIGATGTGKTPLGNYLATHSLYGRRCCHFDFGEQLRQAAANTEQDDGLTAAERIFLQQVLKEGRLLEDRDFPIALKILQSFIRSQNINTADWIVLNGLPRHTGQAEALASLVQVQHVIYLQADAETVAVRIATNAGGDRTGREDDQLELVQKKLAIFTEHTLPLVEYYQARDVDVRYIQVNVDTDSAAVVEQI